MVFSDFTLPIQESGSNGSKRRQAYSKLMSDLNKELNGKPVKSKLTPITKKIDDLETNTMTTDKEDWFTNPKDHSRLAVYTVNGVKDDNVDTNADCLYEIFDKLDYEGFYFFLRTDDDDNITIIGLYDGSDDLNESAEYLNETKRSNLPDSVFGIPEDRKFPLDTEQHVRSAIKLFGHAEAGKKKSLAKRISRAAHKYGIEIPETTQVYKYLHEDNIINESSNNGVLYHISSYKDAKVLHPSVPNNFLTSGGYEDNKTKRVCFTGSIEKCLRALSGNIKDKDLYVYIPEEEYKVYKPSKKEVPDVGLTGEVWIKEPVNVKYIGQIHVSDSIGDGISYKYGYTHTAELYDWNYSWIDRIDESFTKCAPLDNAIIVIDENYIINKDNLEVNVDDFKSGKSNILLITGLSGSGKSTMAKQLASKYHAEYVELDQFEIAGFSELEDLKKSDKILYEFLSSHKDALAKVKKLCAPDTYLTQDEYNSTMLSYVNFVINYCNKDKSNKYVIEGVQIYNAYKDNPGKIKKYPIIIKGESALTSFVRSAKRGGVKGFIGDVARLPRTISWYIQDEKTLNKFIKGIQNEDKPMNESVRANMNNKIQKKREEYENNGDVSNKNLKNPYLTKNFNMPPDLINVATAPSFNIPDFVNTEKLKSLGINAANECIKNLDDKARNAKTCPFKKFETIEITSSNYENAINSAFKKLKPMQKLSARIYQYNYNSGDYKISLVFVATKDSIIKLWYIDGHRHLVSIKMNDNKINESADEDFDMPVEELPDLKTLLYNTDPKKIYLTADWHLFKGHYKHEANYVNTENIIAWCRQNIKDDDIFIYMGDISYKFANKKDMKEAQRIMDSLPGIKVLIIGNHDAMLGQDFFTGCGFQYVIESLTWDHYIFTHIPIQMENHDGDMWNIHSHIHTRRDYNTTDGKRNVNIYPYFNDNKPFTLDYVMKHKESMVKDNYRSNRINIDEGAYLNETKRSNLPDSVFGIPEDRKFPLDTEQHVRSAIKLFGHAEESKKKSLAKKISRAASKYDISIPETTQVYKYLHENIILNPGDGIKNIIFDFGSVLVENRDIEEVLSDRSMFPKECYRDLKALVDKFITHHEDHEYLHTCDIEDAVKYITMNSPGYLKFYIKPLLNKLAKLIHKCEWTDAVLDKLRADGYNLYYLSNWEYYSYKLREDFFKTLLNRFDGGLFSFQTGINKPDIRFYQALLDKYNLDPLTCRFYDDKQENIDAAVSLGIDGILFDASDREYPSILTGIDPSQFINYAYAREAFVIESDNEIDGISLDDIKKWYITANDGLDADEDYYRKSLDEAIKEYHDMYHHDEYNVFTYDYDDKEMIRIPLGKIRVNDDYSYDWIIQYPLKKKDGKLVSCIEWAMNACNPVIGVTKPFILKVGGTSEISDTIDPTQYALSPDIISDKYLVVNENAILEVVDSSIFDDNYIEEYEYIGNKLNLRKIEEAYENKSIVDTTFFYSALSGKPMLTEDQIDFDSNFKKVDFELMREKRISEAATNRDTCLYAIGYKVPSLPVVMETYVLDSIPFFSKYNIYDEFCIKEDFDGYYFYNRSNNKRSGSVSSSNMLTEAMLRSIL